MKMGTKASICEASMVAMCTSSSAAMALRDTILELNNGDPRSSYLCWAASLDKGRYVGFSWKVQRSRTPHLYGLGILTKSPDRLSDPLL